MNKGDFYNDKRKERKINFFADIRVITRYLCTKHDIKRAEFEMLLKMHSMGTFLKADFDSAEGVFPWMKDRWFHMQKAGWIFRYRNRKPSEGRNYAIYSISEKAKKMIDTAYKIACGEEGIPESPQFNPIMKEERYSDKKYAEAIRAFNKTRQNRE